MSRYGDCDNCNHPLDAVWFIEEEYKVEQGRMHKTGRKRKAVSHLVCECCGKNYCVDDTFDGKWS